MMWFQINWNLNLIFAASYCGLFTVEQSNCTLDGGGKEIKFAPENTAQNYLQVFSPSSRSCRNLCLRSVLFMLVNLAVLKAYLCGSFLFYKTKIPHLRYTQGVY